MKLSSVFKQSLLVYFLLSFTALANATLDKNNEPPIPRFSIEHMDKSVNPSNDFYSYANGNWVKQNPVPADRAIWTSFGELDERNEYLLHKILEDASVNKGAPAKSATRLVGDFFASAMDTDRLEKLRLMPLKQDLAAIEQVKNVDDLFKLLANFHNLDVDAVFSNGVSPDKKDSSIYAFQIMQGGLTLPDRDYYFKDEFESQRAAYLTHLQKMFTLLGETAADAANHAAIVMNIETELAKVSRTRVERRDPIKNYNKFSTSELIAKYSFIPWKAYFSTRGIADLPYVIVGQPEFFVGVEKLIKERPISDWKVYLRWHVLHAAATLLNEEVETENFNFFGKVLQGQQQQKPRWKRAQSVIDDTIGEALGQLYVEKCFPKEAKARMNDLVNNLRVVFQEHLEKIDWMSAETREKALAKFKRFTQKIGYPDKFRDYSAVDIKRDDYFGNVRRASQFEIKRNIERIGKSVDKTEWGMTPPTVNAYFSPLLNEIVFPAGILQPPFFDITMDDAVNYGAIAVVIGHEITHGYDDQGRRYDADGVLNEWWTENDAKEFTVRAQKIIDEYNSFEILPGLHVNGELTLGENIADLGGISIAYDALERALDKDPSKRKIIDGFTPEQRFFLSYAQLWRTNINEAEARRRITVDLHAPGKFRAFGPLLNYQEFYDAFNIKPGALMWRAPQLRAKIW